MFGDCVPGEVEVVICVGTDVGAAGGGVVVEDFCCAEFVNHGVVVGTAGCEDCVAGTLGLFVRFVGWDVEAPRM